MVRTHHPSSFPAPAALDVWASLSGRWCSVHLQRVPFDSGQGPGPHVVGTPLGQAVKLQGLCDLCVGPGSIASSGRRNETTGHKECNARAVTGAALNPIAFGSHATNKTGMQCTAKDLRQTVTGLMG
jgi:hypothetical protein